jgi:hypothetical protein
MKFIHLIISLTFISGVTSAQTPWILTGNTVGSGNFLGTTNAQPLEIMTTSTSPPQPINFYTNGAQQMTINDGGSVGIGTTFTNSRLTVLDNIEALDLNGGYLIANEYVLTCRNQSSSIYVGIDAGASIGAPGSGGANTFVGHRSGFSNTTGGANTYIGNGAGDANVDGENNVAIGTVAARDGTTGSDNISIGVFSALNNEGDGNISIGTNTGEDNVTGDDNVFIGRNAQPSANNLVNAVAIGANAQVGGNHCVILGSVNGVNGAAVTANVGIGLNLPTHRLDVGLGNINVNTAANGYMIDDQHVLRHGGNSQNIFVGAGAGNGTVAGIENTFVGAQAGNSNTTGIENTFVGFQAGTSNTIGNGNAFVGESSGMSNTDGEHNVFVGEFSGVSNTVGFQNVFIGTAAGNTNTTGDRNTCLGEHSDLGNNNLDYATAIGCRAVVTQSNSLVLGAIQGQNGAPNNTNVGIGTTAPATRLEVNNIANGSGLRLTQLTTADAPVTNPGTGVLSVNGSGDVIYVTDNGGGTVGACATGTTNTVTKWCNGTDITNSIIFDDGINVGIGVTSTFGAHLDVLNNASTTSQFTGIRARTIATGGLGNYGIEGTCLGASSVFNVGVLGSSPSTSSVLNSGVWGIAVSSNNVVNVGVNGLADGNNLFNIGGMFVGGQSCSPTTYFPVNIGVLASATGYEQTVTTCTPGLAGLFLGNALATGDFYPNVSDVRFKDSIQPIIRALSVINELQPKEFVFKNTTYPHMNFPVGKRFGLIAQSVDTIIPELVGSIISPQMFDTSGTMTADSLHFKAVNYTGLIPIAIAGIQEQQAIIDTIRNDQVTSDDTGITDTNRVVKWSFTNRQLTNSLLYDDGSRLGLPTIKQGVFFNVANAGTDTVAANFTATTKTTEAVVNAVYARDSGQTNVPAVRGYSKYLFEPGEEDGTGGSFEGGRYGVHGLASGIRSKGIGVFGESLNADSKNTGVAGYALGVTSADNIGVRGMADGSDFGNGAFVGSSEYVNPTSINAAYVGYAAGSSNLNFGGDFEAYDTIGINYGIYAYANGSAPDAYAGYFTGDVHATGTVTWTSDATLKTNVEEINSNNALSLITRLQPKTYTFRTNDYPYLSLPQGNQYGLLAQDVQQVIPALVSDIKQPARRNAEGTEVSPALDYKGLNYTGLIPLLVGAVKEQQLKIDSQQTQIDSLKEVISNRLTDIENRLNGCCGTGESNKTDGGTPNHLTVELSSTQVVILEQNVPNPFAEQTSISYFIPENIRSAQMVFTDVLGNPVKTVDVKSGYGTVTVFAQNLTSGQYSYSLIIDGKVAETKRMIKTK